MVVCGGTCRAFQAERLSGPSGGRSTPHGEAGGQGGRGVGGEVGGAADGCTQLVHASEGVPVAALFLQGQQRYAQAARCDVHEAAAGGGGGDVVLGAEEPGQEPRVEAGRVRAQEVDVLAEQGSGVLVVRDPGHRGPVAAAREGAYEHVPGGDGLRRVGVEVDSPA